MILLETIPMGALFLIMFYTFMVLWIFSETIDSSEEPKKKTILFIMFFVLIFLASLIGVFTKIMGLDLII